MNKSILNEETQELLKDSGVSEKEIKRIKKEYIYTTTLQELKKITKHFEDKHFEEIEFEEIKTFRSLDGDGYGNDNTCLKFSCGEDIGEILDELIN